MASNMFWHVPSWTEQTPSASGQWSFDTSGNMVIPLLETETASESIAPDNYWVERIVGQYVVKANKDTGAFLPFYMHSRVYVMPADQLGVDTRDLGQKDDADTSFMMHKVELIDDSINGAYAGNWGQGALDTMTLTPPISRLGGFDIRVGRKVEAGTALIWHSFMQGAEWPDGIGQFSVGIDMWVRVLLKQLG